MRTGLPMIIAFLAGMTMVVAFFIPNKSLEDFSQGFLVWMTIVGGFTLLLGIVNILRNNLKIISQRGEGWGYKVILVLILLAMGVSSFIWGTSRDTPYDWLFQNIQKPMQATMFSVLAFFVASAAYRAFRARSKEATLLLLTSVVVMLGRIPLGQFIWEKLPLAANWIMGYPSLAVQRGIIIGAALGAAAMSLRIILGIERTYMGKG